MTWLFFALGWARKALDALVGVVTRYPLQCALCASLALTVWCWRGWSDEKADHEADVAELTAASDMNHAAQIAQVKALEAKSEQIAKGSNNEYHSAVAESRVAVAAYANAHRCTVPQARISAPGQASSGNDTAVPTELPAEANGAFVSDSDLQAVAELYAYALAAHNNAVDKIEAGTAKGE